MATEQLGQKWMCPHSPQDLRVLLPRRLMNRMLCSPASRFFSSSRRNVRLMVPPSPALSSALAYFDGLRCGRLPANLLQAMRDYFGAHTYERVDAPRGEHFHTDWTNAGGATASTFYNA